jgi:hypothetical protein
VIEVNHTELTTDNYPEPTFPARYDFESWCYYHHHAKGETGEAARFVLGDMRRGC